MFGVGVTNADRCQIGVDRVTTTPDRKLAADNCETPTEVIFVRIRAKQLRVPPADNELNVVLATEAQRTGTTLVELPLHERDVHFIALAKRHDGGGKLARGLALAAIADRKVQ